MLYLNVCDFEEDKIKKTVTRNFCPTKIYLEFCDIQENASTKTSAELIEELRGPMMRLFPELTDEDYENVLIGDVLGVFTDVLRTAPNVRTPPSDAATKN